MLACLLLSHNSVSHQVRRCSSLILFSSHRRESIRLRNLQHDIRLIVLGEVFDLFVHLPHSTTQLDCKWCTTESTGLRDCICMRTVSSQASHLQILCHDKPANCLADRKKLARPGGLKCQPSRIFVFVCRWTSRHKRTKRADYPPAFWATFFHEWPLVAREQPLV